MTQYLLALFLHGLKRNMWLWQAVLIKQFSTKAQRPLLAKKWGEGGAE